MTASNMGNAPEKNNNKEERKLRKPLIEKKRRERINCSLEQLKGIMVDAYNLDQSKLEKADVLEITVQHMEGLQRGYGAGGSGSTMNFESRQRYGSGYIQCMHEVHNLLLSCPGMDKTLGARLLNHLLKSLPHVSGESVALGAGNSSPGSNSSVRSNSPHSPSPSPSPSPAPAPLSAGSQQQHPSLALRSSPSPPPTSRGPSTPHSSPGIPQLNEGRASGPVREGPSPLSPPSPGGHPGQAPPALPPFFPGGDPSMWRPW
ncbi:hairy-related 8a isoform X1 [Alosa sapidissima]|uniref:hairy-related 8a isoform X1 n=2 Tax=Alosa sapidissima TaxID=34773 RepID=UPI001C0931E5|nr:hairy-related 8a isoform X1 [Alosa sapidissima]XP_041927014.1 hairy-related 8a isoform X1 [Alosa sapidissima]XP_041927015.1 hairy-related 8a isoform X1 [Alosa sapidissima]XP_041927016.1 hairy-related 8a isoform X1 [Alosa sapidissima]